jgi:NAD-dependent deacetylase
MVTHIRKNSPIVILTGAGISAESGIQTFRSSDGLWCGHKIEDVATPEAFARNPDLVHMFYNMRRRQLLSPEIKPNTAHEALARLEREWDAEVTLITQNIDNLHTRAGSENLIHMHGELLKAFCIKCRNRIEVVADLYGNDSCRFCGLEGGLRPDIVWFGEMPYDMDRIYELLSDCELFLSIGTSGNVYPAAGFVMAAKAHGAHTIEINLEETLVTNAFDEHRYGAATKSVPDFIAQLLAT